MKPEKSVFVVSSYDAEMNPKFRPGFDQWYIAHELAHLLQRQFNKHSTQHDKYFYQAFKLLCPAEYQHYELEYKPRNAKAAGVSLVGVL